MRLLDRYLLRELLLPLAYCVGGFLISFITFDLFKDFEEFQRAKLTAGEMVEYYANRVPELLVTSYVLPMALLLALLYALTNHSRHHELTAMRAAGLSLIRISVPYFVVGLIFSGIVFYLNEEVVPNSADNAEEILLRHGPTRSKDVAKVWRRNVLFINPVDNRSWQIGAYNMQTRVMYNPQVDWRLADGTRWHIFAEKGWWVNRHWVFTNVQQFIYPSVRTDFPEKRTLDDFVFERMTETPRLIRSEIKISAIGDLRSLRKTQISTAALLDYLNLHPTMDDKRRDSLETMLHSRLAAPWTCFVVVLIAVPFGSLPGRRNVFVGVASSIFICFIFFVAKDLALALGSSGRMPAWLAAWSTNVFFAITGLVLMWRVR